MSDDKIRVNIGPRVAINHLANCVNCQWTAEWSPPGRSRVQQQVITHVRATGHMVYIDETRSQRFQLDTVSG